MNKKIYPFASRTWQLVVFQILVTGLFIGSFFMGLPWYYYLISFGVFFLQGCLGVTLTFHRYFTHRSFMDDSKPFQMPKWMERVFTIFGCLGGTGSSIGWVSTHVPHHPYADTEKDPHSPQIRGLKVLIAGYDYHFNMFTARRLIVDKFHRFMHEYYLLILIAWISLLLLISFNTFMIVFAIPAFYQVTVSVLSNYFNHMPQLGGYRTYDTPDKSVNVFWLFWCTFGESHHNNHHKYPRRANFKIKWWEFDLTYQMMKLLNTNK